MSPAKTRHIRRALLSKGFVQDKTHHEMYWLSVGGRLTQIRTRISHGEREYGDPLLSQMARQLKLRRRQFDDLLECPMTGDDYARLLRERGLVGR